MGNINPIGFDTSTGQLRPISPSDAISAPGTGAGSEKFGAGSIAAGAGAVALGPNTSAGAANSLVIGNAAILPSQATETILISPEGTTVSFSGNMIDKAIIINSGALIGINNCHETVAIGWLNIPNGPYQVSIGANQLNTAPWTVAIGGGCGEGGFANVIVIGGHVAATKNHQIVMGFDDYTTLGGAVELLFNGKSTTPPATFTVAATAGNGAGVAGSGLRLAGGISGSSGTAGGAVSIATARTGSATGLTTHTTFNADGTTAFSGNIKLNGSTSGTITLSAGTAPTSTTYTLPTNFGASNSVLTDAAGDGTLSWVVSGPFTTTAGIAILTTSSAYSLLYLGSALSSATPTNFSIRTTNGLGAGVAGAGLSIISAGASDGDSGFLILNTANATGTNRSAGSITSQGGSATGSGQGASLSYTGGAGGTTGLAGNVSFTSGTGGSVSGDSGILSFQTGVTTDGNTGDVFLSTASPTGTNRSSGQILYSTGSPTGSGISGQIKLATGTPTSSGVGGPIILATALGTAGNKDRHFISAKRLVLTNNTITVFATVLVITGAMVGFTVHYTARATNATDFAVERGSFYVAAVNKAGTITANFSTVGTVAQAVSGGATITVTPSLADAGSGVLNVRINVNSSLTTTVDFAETFISDSETLFVPQ